MDSRCRATIGRVSNPNHGARKLRKAVQSRWLGRHPVPSVELSLLINSDYLISSRGVH
ncbi:hypothetical protein ACB094_09G089100 [Castanea mollissima]